MMQRCPECGLSYFPEQGYYVGAMIINYIATTACVLATFSAVPAGPGLHDAFNELENPALDGIRDYFVPVAGAAFLQFLARDRLLGETQGTRPARETSLDFAQLQSPDQLRGDTRQRATNHEPRRVHAESQQQDRAGNRQSNCQPIHDR